MKKRRIIIAVISIIVVELIIRKKYINTILKPVKMKFV